MEPGSDECGTEDCWGFPHPPLKAESHFRDEENVPSHPLLRIHGAVAATLGPRDEILVCRDLNSQTPIVTES